MDYRSSNMDHVVTDGLVQKLSTKILSKNYRYIFKIFGQTPAIQYVKKTPCDPKG